MIIKVCGMREPDNIHAVSELGIDMIGFIFWKESPRFVKQISSRAGIIPDYSSLKEEDMPDLDKNPKRVGVFVNEMPQTIITRVYNYKLDYIQLHGEETRILCENLRRTIDPDIRKGLQIIKAIRVSKPEDIADYKDYEGAVDLFLFDTKCACVGGSGEQFDWSLLKAYDGETPFILSGGIGPDDVEKVRNFHHPKCVGIDLNSQFETEPGVKDVEKLKTFIDAVKKA